MARIDARAGWAVGGSVFAACMLLMAGVWQVLVGIAALAQDEIFVTTPDYMFQFDLTQWGTVHIIVGALLALVGFFIFTGKQWAYWTGIALAVVSATTQFFWLPWQPLWSMVMIAIDVFVIWALATASGATSAAKSRDEEHTTRRTGDWSNLDAQDSDTATNQSKEMDEARSRTETEPRAGRHSERRRPETT